jgi:hypothetical protein
MNTANVIETLKLLRTVTFDGNLPSKNMRDFLEKQGLVDRVCGYNWLSAKGVDIARVLFLLGDE